MLAVLMIEMEWQKENRTPASAVQRQNYYQHVKIEEGVNLSGDGIFLKKCRYYQQGTSVFFGEERTAQMNKKLFDIGIGKAFTGSDEYEHRRAGRWNKSIQKDKGYFYDIDRLDIPYITISEEAGNCYRIRWFDAKMGKPYRRGGNEQLYEKGAKLAGKTDVLNETAFILEEGRAGMLKYNYRCTSYHGQWYKCYYIYIVNEKNLTQDIFLRTYDYEYNQLADLF